MDLCPDEAQELLRRVDPGRIYSGWPVGLRDGALLALVAAGLSAVEIATLKASAITMAGPRVIVTIRKKKRPNVVVLKPGQGARVLAWLYDRRIWGAAEPVFTTSRGPLTPRGACAVVERYRNHR